MEKDTGFEPNVRAVFSYLIPLFGGIVVFVTEKQNQFVRFHAFQSILLWASSWIVLVIAQTFPFSIVSFITVPLLSVIVFGTWLYCMWKSYNNIEYKLPFLGKIAHDQVFKA